MRVGIVTDAFPPEVGGIQTFAEQYVSHLVASREVDHVDVLAFTPGENESDGNLSITRLSATQTPIKVVKGLQWFHRRELDVVHSLTLYPSGLIAALCGRLENSVSTFTTVYGLDAISVANHPILGPIHRFIFDSLDEVLFFSDSTREKTHDTYDASFPSRRIYPGVPTFASNGCSTPTAVPEEEDQDFVVLTVARLVERKGIDDLIDAVANLSDVELWIAGDGPEFETLQQQVPSKATGRVRFLGEVDHDALPELYKSADVFCLPSVYLKDQGDIEGLGLVFLEAQRFGLPVIGTRSGGIPEAFADGETGFLVEERAPDQIQNRLIELRDNPGLYEDFSNAAVEFVREEFAWEDCVQNHLEIYSHD